MISNIIYFYRRTNYGFITFYSVVEATAGYELGQSPNFPQQYNVSFGKRRDFCRQQYYDHGMGKYIRIHCIKVECATIFHFVWFLR